MNRNPSPAFPRADDLRWDDKGLIPGVVQDARTGQILMVAYLNQQSYRLTLQTGQVHFWSRSRQELWLKGATSGSLLELVDLAADCDSDTLLITARPMGPACHRHTVTCFNDTPADQGFYWLERLWEVINSRATTMPPGSYTTRLLEGGVNLTGRKLVEEATEVLIAAQEHAHGEQPSSRVAEEMADLLYHLLVVSAERRIDPSQIIAVLEERFGN